MKRKLVARDASPPLCFTKKQLRSRLSRRRRLHISPIVRFSDANSHLTERSELSCDSVSNNNNSRNNYQKPKEFRSYEFQRAVTRSYYRNNKLNATEAHELSENSSCVESTCSGANKYLKLKSTNVEEAEAEVTKSVVSSTSRLYDVVKVQENEDSCVESTYAGANRESKYSKTAKIEELEAEVTKSVVSTNSRSNDVVEAQENENSVEITQNRITGGEQIRECSEEVEKATSVQKNVVVSVTSENKAAQEEEEEGSRRPKFNALEFDLACSEQFSNGGVLEEEEEYNSLSSGIFHVVSDTDEFESSDCTSSLWSYASGSQFSEKSSGDESSSPTFELFKEFKQHFCRSTLAFTASEDDHHSNEIAILGLDSEEDEESYRMMRRRERRQVYVRDYAEEYCNITDHGDLVIQQRLHMVHWIIEQATSTELQKETMFLGVCLLDRFLSKGYFKTKRNLQIAGIACLTLATRIEENQPYNCVRRKMFDVESNTYGRCEVVAMEWLVQEVLNFQCFLPTLYNFLWFYLKAARANENVEKTSKYLAVLTLMGHQHLCYWPSTVAAGLVILASIAANENLSCHLVTAIHDRQKDKDLPDCVKSLEWLVKYL